MIRPLWHNDYTDYLYMMGSRLNSHMGLLDKLIQALGNYEVQMPVGKSVGIHAE